MNAIRDVIYPDGGWINIEGRPKGSGTKESLVKEYLSKNPTSTPTEIARELGISRTTVYKYLEKWPSSKKESFDGSCFFVKFIKDHENKKAPIFFKIGAKSVRV